MENFRLRVFRAVARHLNFRLAAEELLLTQPAVTQQIKALEAELSTPLLDRSGGRATMTAAGAALLPFADRLARSSAEAREAVAAATGATAGQLALGASQTIGQYLMPRLIAGFMAEHPRVQVSVSGGNTRTVLNDLRARRIQLADRRPGARPRRPGHAFYGGSPGLRRTSRTRVGRSPRCSG